MLRTKHFAWLAGLCGLTALACLSAGGQAAAPDDAKSLQDREKVQKELRELESQRAKIDSRIGELRRQAGRGATRTFIYNDRKAQFFGVPGDHGFLFSDGNVQGLKELSAEQRKKVDEAMTEARKALEKAKMDLPEGFVLPDIDGIVGNSLRFHALPNGRSLELLTPALLDKEKMKEQIDRLRRMPKSNAEVYRNYVTPRVYTTPGIPAVPAMPGSPLYREGSQDLRNEVRELRQEVERLRGEIRRDRGGKKDRNDTKTQFLEPFGAI